MYYVKATIRAVPSLVVPAHVTVFSVSVYLFERNKWWRWWWWFL